MFSIQKIICPIDFSEHSYDALKIAVEMARQFSSEVILLHVITPIPSCTAAAVSEAGAAPQFDLAECLRKEEAARKDSGTGRAAAFDPVEYLAAAAKQSLDKVLSESVPDAVQSRSVILRGQPAESIVEFSAQEKASMIVISTHGRTGLRHFIFGSVAEKVIRLAACPVLSIRPKQEKGE